MQTPESDGWFDVSPARVLIAGEFEKRFLSAGNFQALFEFIPSLIGMESGMIIPTIFTMPGLRFSHTGFGFGLGLVLWGVRLAEGYFDEKGK